MNNKKLTLAHVISDLNFGGAGKYVLDVVNNIDKDKFKIYVIIPRGSLLLDYLSNIQYINVIEADGIGNKSFSTEGVKNVKKILKDIKPDIIHSHACLSARIAGKLLGINNSIYTRHCIQPELAGVKKIIVRFMEKIFSSKVIAVSKEVYKNLENEGTKKIYLIYNGVKIEEKNLDRKYLTEKYNIDKNKIILTLVGRLEKVKGHAHLLKIIEILKEKKPNFEVLLVGEGTERDYIKGEIEEKNLPIRLMGHIKNIDEIYELSDITLNTSNSEALSFAIIESFAHKKAAVAFNIDGIPEVIDDGENGYLVDFEDYNKFSEKLEELIDNEKLRNKLGESGYIKAKKYFDIKVTIKELEKVYMEEK